MFKKVDSVFHGHGEKLFLEIMRKISIDNAFMSGNTYLNFIQQIWSDKYHDITDVLPSTIYIPVIN